MNYFAYFSEIESAFVRRRGRNLLLSPLDWALIEAWKERGVPLFIVLRAIEMVFDQAQARDANQPRKRPIKSLLYCRDEVETQYAVWLEAQVGTEANGKISAAKTIAANKSGGKINSENAESPAATRSNQSEAPTNQASNDNAAFPAEQILAHLKRLQTHYAGENKALNGTWQNLSNRVTIRLKEAETVFLINLSAESLEAVLSELDFKIDQILNKIFAPEALAQIEKETDAQLRQVKRQMPPDVFAETRRALLIKSLREAADLPRFSLFYL